MSHKGSILGRMLQGSVTPVHTYFGKFFKQPYYQVPDKGSVLTGADPIVEEVIWEDLKGIDE